MGVRRQAREAALQALFMCDFIGAWDSATIQLCFDHFSMPKNIRPFSTQLCEGVLEHLSKIDAKLTCASEHWSLTRMGRVDRNILRIASFEILFLEEIPINVAINEAIEIAKRYGSEESPQFVNGVLDRVASMARPKQQIRSKLEVEIVADDASAGDSLQVEALVAIDQDGRASDELELADEKQVLS